MKRILCLILLLALILPAHAEAGISETHVRCIASHSVNLRTGPGEQYDKVGSLVRGETARLIDSAEGWHQVEYDRQQVWVSAQYVEFVTLTDHLSSLEIQDALLAAELCPAMGVARCSRAIPAYAAPSGGNPSIGMLEANAEYPVYEQRDGFLRLLDCDSFVWVETRMVDSFEIHDSIVLNQDFHARSLDSALKKRIQGKSYKSNCTVPHSDLRYVSILYYDFDGNIHRGEIMCNAAVARDMLVIFNVLYQAKYGLTEVSLVDNYNAEDRPSMSANNTSCFNFRVIAGSSKLSNHALGLAIDVNPKLNPYVQGDYVSPKNAYAYADRTRDFPGKIDANDLAYQLFLSYGWEWGGIWTSAQDYQHFEKYL